MGKKIEKEIDEPIYEPIQEEYASKQDVINRLFEIYMIVKNGIENSGLKGKHEARTELDKNHCVATITRLKHEICDTAIGAMWIKLKCPKFKDMVNTVIDTYLYDWINQEAELEQMRLEFSDDPTIKADEYKYNICTSKVFKEKIIPFLKMYFEIIVLQNIIKKKGLEPSNIEKKAGKPKKTPKEFEEYLAYPNKTALVAKIRELIIDNDKRHVAIIIMAMGKKNIVNPMLRKELYDSMRNRFGDIIGTDQNINNLRNSGGITQDEIDGVVANLLLNE